MQHFDVKFEAAWQVLGGSERSQAAVMVVAPGGAEGGPDNTHPGDQWLYVAAGEGKALVGGREAALRPGVLLLIEAGEPHEIRCTGQLPLRTLNVYAPPVYGKEEA